MVNKDFHIIVCVCIGVVIVVSMGVVFGLLIGASMLGVAVCLLRWYSTLICFSLFLFLHQRKQYGRKCSSIFLFVCDNLVVVKGSTKLMAVTSSSLNRFLKFFHNLKEKVISNKLTHYVSPHLTYVAALPVGIQKFKSVIKLSNKN